MKNFGLLRVEHKPFGMDVGWANYLCVGIWCNKRR